MKKFKEAEIKSMLDMVTKDMISFSRFCELINERITEKPAEFKDRKAFMSSGSLSEHIKRIDNFRKMGGK